MGGKRGKLATAVGSESFSSRGMLSQESLALFLAFQFKDSAFSFGSVNRIYHWTAQD